MSLPICISELIQSSAAPLGFSGSRSVVPPVLSAVLLLVARSSCMVFVGCALGVDGMVRAELGAHRLRVFTVCRDSGRGGFAARSIDFVDSLAAASGSLLSFPSGVCPVGLVPSYSASRCFSGFGSGSWATLAWAVGLGVPCFIFLGVSGAPSGWDLADIGWGWWASTPGPCPLYLF